MMATQELTPTVTSEVAAELERQVAAGGYTSPSDVVHEALADRGAAL